MLARVCDACLLAACMQSKVLLHPLGFPIAQLKLEICND